MQDESVGVWAKDSLALLALRAPVHSAERSELLAAGVSGHRVQLLYGTDLEDQTRALVKLLKDESILQFFANEAFVEVDLWSMLNKIPDAIYTHALGQDEDLTGVAWDEVDCVVDYESETDAYRDVRARRVASDLATMIVLLNALQGYPFESLYWVQSERDSFHVSLPLFQAAVKKILDRTT